MIGVIATLKIQADKSAEFEAIFKELTARVRAGEPGNIAYQLTKSRSDPQTYKVLELYADQDALTAHGQSPHFRELAGKMGPCLGAPPEIEYLDGV